MLRRRLLAGSVLAAVMGGIAGCSSSVDRVDAPDPEQRVFAVTDSNVLIRFLAEAPEAVDEIGMIPLSGGEDVVGLDFRPASGALFALTSDARLLQIDPENAQATEVTANIIPEMGMLDGNRVDIDFNPAANALRIVTDAGQNLRIGPGALPDNDGGPAIIDGQLGYRQGVAAAAYTFPNPPEMRAAGTTLFVIDAEEGVLYTQEANPGILMRVGSLGVELSAVNGYDVAETELGVNEHYAALTVNGQVGLYTLDPLTGDATLVETLDEPGNYIDLVALQNEDNPLLRDIVVFIESDAGEARLDFYSFEPLLGTLELEMALPITGLIGGDRIVGVDVRTTARTSGDDTGYALADSGRIYQLTDDQDPPTAIEASEFAQLSVALQGTAFGMDFNPRVDLLRIVSDTGQNLRVNLEEGREIAGEARAAGFAFVDGTVRLGDPLPQAIGVAYRSEPLMLADQVPALDFQYIIDARDSSLGRVVVPNDGAIDRVGPLSGAPTLPGNNPAALQQGMDIAGLGAALAALRGEGEIVSTLFAIDLTSGAASAIGVIGGSDATEGVRAIAVEIVVD